MTGRAVPGYVIQPAELAINCHLYDFLFKDLLNRECDMTLMLFHTVVENKRKQVIFSFTALLLFY